MIIQFFTAGGTIDKVYFDKLSRYEIGDSQIRQILGNARVNFEYIITELLKKDSLEMTEQDRKTIVSAVSSCPADRIVITHGTDTMIDTARHLKPFGNQKTIVLTGAMEPSKFSTSDAAFNIGAAVSAVQAMPHGVYLAVSGRIFDVENVRKNREKLRFEEKM